MNIKLTKIKYGPGTQAFQVCTGPGPQAIIIGYIVRHNNTRTEKFPWQAYGVNAHGQFGDLLGSFYGRTGKARAIEAITVREAAH